MEKAHLWDVERLIEREIDAGLSQRQIAMTYALAIRSSYPTDWSRVNRAIVAKWPKGLDRIKKMAHSGSCFTSNTNSGPRRDGISGP